MREMVGAMQRGPMKRSIHPMSPENPSTIWKSDASMMAPCSCNANSDEALDSYVCNHFMPPEFPMDNP